MLFFAPRRGMSRISIRMRFFSMTDITRNACKHRQYPLSESIYTKKCSMSCCLDDHHKRRTLMGRCLLKIAQLECKVQQRLHRHCIKLTADFKVCPFDPHLKSSYTTFPLIYHNDRKKWSFDQNMCWFFNKFSIQVQKEV